MRAKYAGWYTRSPEKLSKIWDTAIFVPDANVLLHCLRHAAPVRDELLRVFSVLKESLWIPYQVGLEFHRNRLEVEVGAEDAYERLCQDYQSAFNQASDRLKQLRAHPVISVDAELKVLNRFMDGFRDRMAKARDRHPRDEITKAVDRLTSLLDGRVGDKWPAGRLSSLKKEGEERYSRKVPPGYKDAKKDAGEFDKYGDLIIWMDMMEKAKAERRPVVFISDDAKEDWWWIHRGRKLGPRPELIEEFLSHSEQEFHIYEFTQFLRVAAQRHPEMKPGVEEIEKSLRDDEEARKRQNDAALASDELAVKITRLEDEREQVVSALSGQPAFDGPPVRMDVASLRTRLESLNAELSVLRRAELTVLRAL